MVNRMGPRTEPPEAHHTSRLMERTEHHSQRQIACNLTRRLKPTKNSSSTAESRGQLLTENDMVYCVKCCLILLLVLIPCDCSQHLSFILCSVRSFVASVNQHCIDSVKLWQRRLMWSSLSLPLPHACTHTKSLKGFSKYINFPSFGDVMTPAYTKSTSIAYVCIQCYVGF